jgi:hypothetical protein
MGGDHSEAYGHICPHTHVRYVPFYKQNGVRILNTGDQSSSPIAIGWRSAALHSPVSNRIGHHIESHDQLFRDRLIPRPVSISSDKWPLQAFFPSSQNSAGTDGSASASRAHSHPLPSIHDSTSIVEPQSHVINFGSNCDVPIGSDGRISEACPSGPMV